MSALAVASTFSYFDEVKRAMNYLWQVPEVVFVGQSVKWDGHALFKTLEGVPEKKRIELPVIEDFQMGYSTGLALQGFIPVSIFPRWDFLILAANQLVNHLDKIPLVSGFKPKVIVRTTVGSKRPLDPGPQHCQNHTEAFRLMLKTVNVIELLKAEDVFPAYESAVRSPGSFLIVEHMDLYSP